MKMKIPPTSMKTNTLILQCPLNPLSRTTYQRIAVTRELTLPSGGAGGSVRSTATAPTPVRPSAWLRERSSWSWRLIRRVGPKSEGEARVFMMPEILASCPHPS